MENILLDFGIVLLAATIGGIAAIKFKQPTVIGLLIAGALIGPHAIGLVKESEIINVFAEIGAVLLLFAIGAEFSIAKLAQLGIKTVLTSTLKLGIVFFLTYQVAILLGVGPMAAVYLGAISAITSTAITIKMLESKGLIKREEVPLLVGMLIIEDIFAVLALTFFSSIKGNPNLEPISIFASLFQSIAIMTITYLVLSKLLKPVFNKIIDYSAEDILPLVAIGLGMGMSYLATVFGLTSSIGAFLAGSLVAGLPKGEVIERAVKPFTLSFSAIFFLAMGLSINSSSILPNIGIIFAILIFGAAARYFGTATGLYLTGSSGKSAHFAGAAMISIGEFSLLIAKEGADIVPFDIIGVSSTAVFLSAILQTFFINRGEQIYERMVKLTPNPALRNIRTVAEAIRNVLSLLEPSNPSFKIITKELTNIVLKIGIISITLTIAFHVWKNFGQATQITVFNYSISVVAIIVGIAVLLVLIPMKQVFSSLASAINVASEVVIKNRNVTFTTKKRITRDIIDLVIVLLVTFNLPIILSFLNLPPLIVQIASIVMLAYGFLIAWDIKKTITQKKM